jgi:hypothetical protein
MLNSVDRLAVLQGAQDRPEDGVPVRFAKGRTPLRFVPAGEPAASRTRDRSECFTFGHGESVMNAQRTPISRSAICADHNTNLAGEPIQREFTEGTREECQRHTTG